MIISIIFYISNSNGRGNFILSRRISLFRKSSQTSQSIEALKFKLVPPKHIEPKFKLKYTTLASLWLNKKSLKTFLSCLKLEPTACAKEMQRCQIANAFYVCVGALLSFSLHTNGIRITTTYFLYESENLKMKERPLV